MRNKTRLVVGSKIYGVVLGQRSVHIVMMCGGHVHRFIATVGTVTQNLAIACEAAGLTWGDIGHISAELGINSAAAEDARTRSTRGMKFIEAFV